jgi:hypothetical protein
MAHAAARAEAENRMHPNARLLEAFCQAQRRFYAGDDDTTALPGLLADESPGICPGAARSSVTTAATTKSWATWRGASVLNASGDPPSFPCRSTPVAIPLTTSTFRLPKTGGSAYAHSDTGRAADR